MISTEPVLRIINETCWSHKCICATSLAKALKLSILLQCMFRYSWLGSESCRPILGRPEKNHALPLRLIAILTFSYCDATQFVAGWNPASLLDRREVDICCALTDITHRLNPSSETNSKSIEPSTLLNNSSITFNEEINPHNLWVNWTFIYN
jgi:hypothetical protein